MKALNSVKGKPKSFEVNSLSIKKLNDDKVKLKELQSKAKLKESAIQSEPHGFDKHFDNVIKDKPNMDEAEMHKLYHKLKGEYTKPDVKSLLSRLNGLGDKIMNAGNYTAKEVASFEKQYLDIEKEIIRNMKK